MSTFCRVITGVSGSPRNLQALRYAAVLARGQDAALVPVLAWVPPGGDVADRRHPSGYLRRVWVDDAPGGGARFCFTLPVAELTAETAEEEAQVGAGTDRR